MLGAIPPSDSTYSPNTTVSFPFSFDLHLHAGIHRKYIRICIVFHVGGFFFSFEKDLILKKKIKFLENTKYNFNENFSIRSKTNHIFFSCVDFL